jgi:hypothetical protein
MGLGQLLQRLRLRALPVSRARAIEIAVAHVSGSGIDARLDAPEPSAMRDGLRWTVWMEPPARGQAVIHGGPPHPLGPPVVWVDGNTGEVVKVAAMCKRRASGTP